MYHSSNYIVRTVFNNALYNSNSCIGYKIAYFRNTYAVDITKHDLSFFFFQALKLLAHIIILPIMQLLTIYSLYVMCDLTICTLKGLMVAI